MWFDGAIDESSFRQINFEWGIVSNSTIIMNGLIKASFESVHIEGVELNSSTSIFKIFDAGYGAKIELTDISLKNVTLLGNDTRIITVSNQFNNDVQISLKNFTAVESVIGTTTGHRVAIREGSIGTNTPELTIYNFNSDITTGNNFLPIEASTYKPVLLRFNDKIFYKNVNGVHYMPSLNSAPSTGVYPSIAIVYNSSMDSASDKGWIIYTPGDFSNPAHGTITVTQYSSGATVDAEAYSYFNIGDYIVCGGHESDQVLKIHNKYNGDTFTIDTVGSDIPDGTYACEVAQPQFRVL
jgi:hypothetical protein